MVCEKREIGGLLDEQRVAAAHRGSHARLLAGPGTGKTWTMVEYVASLMQDGVDASEILCLTFTRAAAGGLKRRIGDKLEKDADLPEVYTLHGFALRQLMRKKVDVGSGRGRLRVADDWEERQVVIEDLGRLLGCTVRETKARLAALSSAWETNPDVEPEEDPPLLGALRKHKERYRYVIRSELVYLLKNELDGDPYFLENAYKYVVVDEYQDLNRCDVSVIDELGARGATLFVAGDDDQSIYQQLRNAHPQSIRDFIERHPGAADLRLTTCVRCDSDIIDIATRVIEQETGREPKDLVPHESAGPGAVHLLSFRNGQQEAEGIATITKALSDAGVELHEILVLLRSDRNGTFSSLIDAEMRKLSIAARVRAGDPTLLNDPPGRLYLGHLRLLLDRTDDLAWRAIIEMPGNRLGDGAIAALDVIGEADDISFGEAITTVAANPTRVPRFGTLIAAESANVVARLDAITAAAPSTVEEWIHAVAAELPASDEIEAVRQELVVLAAPHSASTLADFMTGIALRKEDEEQDLIRGTVNIMSQHKAKGLDACAVIVAAAEEELIAGRGNTDEERRLFYVSLTRARHSLFVTHAIERQGQQAYSAGGGRNHSRTTFLAGWGASVRGLTFADAYEPDIAALSPRTAADAS